MARRRGAAPAIITAPCSSLAVLLIAPHVPVQSIVARPQTSSQFLNDSIGRQAESTGSRSTILSQTEQLYLNFDTPLGIGPGGTKSAFQHHQFSYVKMAHDDYAASLVERGVLGAMALVCLFVIIIARCRRIAARSLAAQLRQHLSPARTARRRRHRHVHLRDVLSDLAFPATVGAARVDRGGRPMGTAG